jgi:hypothetical protein
MPCSSCKNKEASGILKFERNEGNMCEKATEGKLEINRIGPR